MASSLIFLKLQIYGQKFLNGGHFRALDAMSIHLIFIALQRSLSKMPHNFCRVKDIYLVSADLAIHPLGGEI